MPLLVKLLASAALAAIAWIHYKLITGQPLTPAEWELFRQCCR